MIRTQVYLTEVEHKGLKKLSASTGKAQSQLIRDAVDTLLQEKNRNQRLHALQSARGLWKTRKDIPDLRKSRKEFDRNNG